MHIPDAYLSPATEAVAYGVMAPIWTLAARKTSRQLTSRQAPLLSIGAAFCFAVQMFNIPAVGGTTAHALGAALLAILVGPWAAVLGMTLTLAIQALLFGDGGILSLGANSFNMAFVAAFVGYGVFRLCSGQANLGSPRGLFAAGFGAYVGTATASLSAAILLGIQPFVAHDALGHALYCPFGLSVTIPAMTITHLLVAAPAEAIITVAALSYLWRVFPDLLAARTRPKIGQGMRLARVFAWVLVLTPVGLLASGSAWGEWDLSQIAKMVGYAPSGIAHSRELVHPLLPDYAFNGLEGRTWEIAGYLFSALVGCGIVILFTRALLRRPAAEPVVLPERSSSSFPEWLREPNPALPPATKAKAPWFERTVLRMRAAVAKTIAAETVARAPGLLQSVHPTAKAIGFLCALVATGLAPTPYPLLLLLSLALAAAALSRVPLKVFAERVVGATAFFGIVFAAPISLAAVTPGPVVGRFFSEPGLHSAGMILLRLATGIALAQLWNLTTRWHHHLRSLSSLGVPRTVLAAATLTYRYLFVMLETLGDMVEARTARQVGACDKRQARTYAGTGSAVLFAKSIALTEETHLAMQARGFDGTIRQHKPPRWAFADSATVLTGIAILAIVLLQGAFHAL